MSLMAQYVDGKLVTDTSQTKSQAKGSATANGMDKDAFLQLLVAQMKYQDPLEPTSNTEYVSQYATFSELEEMQNMSSSMELSRASGLVGKTVIASSTNATTGKTTEVMGIVDSVAYESGKAYVSIGDSLYSVDNVREIQNEEFVAANEIITKIKAILKNLPSADSLTLSDGTNVVDMYNLYSGMNTYQQSFVDETTQKTIEKYVNAMAELIDAAEKAAEKEAAEKEAAEKKAQEAEGNQGTEQP